MQIVVLQFIFFFASKFSISCLTICLGNNEKKKISCTHSVRIFFSIIFDMRLFQFIAVELTVEQYCSIFLKNVVIWISSSNTWECLFLTIIFYSRHYLFRSLSTLCTSTTSLPWQNIAMILLYAFFQKNYGLSLIYIWNSFLISLHGMK